MKAMGLEKLCRTCLCSEGVMFPLFDEIQELKETGFGTAVEVLETFTFVPIQNIDNFPDRVCANCFNEIKQAYSFTLKCEKSERILNQLKEVKVNLRKQKRVPNPVEEGASHCNLIAIKKEPEETLNIYDYDVGTIKDKAIKSEPKFNQMLPDYQFLDLEAINQVTFKNEPELHIEDMKCDEFGKLCDAEFDCSQLEHSVKHLPICLDEITHNKSFENLQKTNKYCQNCSKHFTDLEKLLQHSCSRTLAKRFNNNKDISAEHVLKKTPAEPKDTNGSTDPKSKHQCSICPKGFSYKYGLTKHMRIHTGETPFKCKFCTEQFLRAARLRVHMEMKHLNELPDGKPKFQCTVCLKILVSKNDYVRHMLIHTDEKPYQCEWCSEKFRYRQAMVSHSQKMHAEELANEKPKYQCSVCSESFRYESDSVTHMRRHADEKKKFKTEDTTHECKFCSKKFLYKSNLNKHMRSHTIAKRQCQICFQNFRHNRMLAIHMETKHINELPEANARNQCRVCSKLLSNRNSLIVHMRSHTGEKPFQCEFCCNSFQHKHLLRVHTERKHLNNLPGDSKPKYQCNVCSTIFSFNRNLVSHMRSHTGEKPFQCEVCLEKFRYHEGLFRHMHTNHFENLIGNKPNYPCSVCFKTYAYKMMLDIHMKTKHGKDLPE